MKSSLLFSVAFATAAFAQQSAWGQCGGQGWTGATTCVAGYVCQVSNAYYSQCVPGTATSAPATTLKTTTASPSKTTSATSPGSTGHLKWLGVSESVAEFGTAIPGTWGKDFYMPDTSTIDVCSSILAYTVRY